VEKSVWSAISIVRSSEANLSAQNLRIINKCSPSSWIG
jgi:hypothetical protein